MIEPISKQHLLRVISLGDVAKMALDSSLPSDERFTAITMLRHRLREFNGALWIGAPVHERKSVITALRMTA